MGRAKAWIAGIASRTGASAALLRAQRITGSRFLRALNYHGVPSAEAGHFEGQLAFYARHFAPVTLMDLFALQAGSWPHDRPGLLLTFDDGLVSHFHIVAPLLEKYGFTGWFLVPTGFVDCPVSERLEWARAHSIGVREDPLSDGRLALSWQELRTLSQRHVIGCHTVDHVRFRSDLAPDVFEHETRAAKRRLEEQLGISAKVFAWVGGEEFSYCRDAAVAIHDAGFEIGFMTNSDLFRPGADLLQIQRTNVESSYSPALVELHLSGLYDLFYRPKRRRVERLTRIAHETA